MYMYVYIIYIYTHSKAGETERETFQTVVGMDQFRIQQLGRFRGVTHPSVVLPIPVPNTSGLFPKSVTRMWDGRKTQNLYRLPV